MANKKSGQGRNAAARKAMRAKRRKRKVLLVCMEVIILGSVLLWIWANAKMDKINTDKSFQAKDVENEDLSEETRDVLGKYTTIALFGLDNRDSNSYNRGNSDVIMLARIDKDTKEVRLVSVYRDTFLKMTDLDNTEAYSKANAAYAVGGPEQAVRIDRKSVV